MSLSPLPRYHNHNWVLKYQEHTNTCNSKFPKVLLIGDSIVAGLERYVNIKNEYFCEKSTINCVIGGDRVQNVLWRAKNLPLPSSLSYVVILCGSNNLNIDTTRDIVEGIISIGMCLKDRLKMLKIIISGIIPRDGSSSVNRIDITDVNTMLKERCQDKGFQFIDQDNGWTLENGELSPGLYYSDKIHLLEKGNKILAEQIHIYLYSI